MAHTSGRRTKLTPELQQRFVQALAAGGVMRTACQYAGISESSLYKWLRQGEAGRAPYVQFVQAVKRAEGEAVMRALKQINAAAETDWHAAAWLLERRCPESYGKRRVVEQQHTGTVQHGHVWIERLQAAHNEMAARKAAIMAQRALEAGRNGHGGDPADRS